MTEERILTSILLSSSVLMVDLLAVLDAHGLLVGNQNLLLLVHLELVVDGLGV